jgi:uncharacterized protein YciI
MKYVVLGESAGASMEQLMQVYPQHKKFTDGLIAKGVVIGLGRFSDRGNMGIFRTMEAAEEFVKGDPFNLAGLVKNYVIKEWHDSLLAE